MLNPELRRLVRITSEHARKWNDDHDHTVSAGLLTASGEIVLGLNTFHFLGGPCGEIAALSNHAASHPQDPIVAVAAVRGPTNHVIPPCGKCRQVFYDIDPAITFIVRDAAGLQSRSAAELLPFAFDVAAITGTQQINMWHGYEKAVRSGKKTQTIRVDDPFQPGPAELVFDQIDGSVVRIDAEVTSVREVALADLTEEDAVLDGFANLQELHAALDKHYPGIGPEEAVDLVSFRLR